MEQAPLTPRSATLATVRETARRIAREVGASEREHTDKDAAWPERTMRAVKASGLGGLVVPEDAGGLGGGFSELVAACEELARENPSSALAFGMHCVGTACIVARATPEQAERYLRPIADGEHVTTLALSERGTGVHFYLPSLSARVDGDTLVLDGEKHFITNAGHADSYVVSTASFDADEDPGRFNLLVADADAPGITLGEPWTGVGMRGNSARAIRFDGTRVPRGNLLGGEGAQTWYVFEVIAPYFLTAMAATYLGVASRAVDEAVAAVRGRTHGPGERGLAEEPNVQEDVAELWMTVEQARHFLYHAARLGDEGAPDAARAIMGAKATLDDVVTRVTTDAITLGGGRAYGANALLALLYRDGLASRVMSPTAPLLKLWAGRSLLGVPLIQVE